jgi:RNA polymerase sigma factor (sigma-70 family)
VWITPEEEVLARELESGLEAAFARLPPDQRQVMELTRQGLPPREIAEQLDCPIKLVYRLLCQARKWLVEELSLTLPASSRGRPRKARPATPEPRSSDT